MHEELGEIRADFEADDDMRAALLAGEGTRTFSVGQDLKELAARERAGLAAPSTFGSRGKPGWPRLTERFDLTKPVVAKVHGHALGGGFALALACDIVGALMSRAPKAPVTAGRNGQAHEGQSGVEDGDEHAPWSRGPGKTRNHHHDRLAVAHVRQSSKQQVPDHGETTRLQYGWLPGQRRWGGLRHGSW